VSPPRWLVDEMLGRLARYLRFVGSDTVYLRGVDDDELVRRSETEARVLLTRDRALSARARGACRIESPVLAEQWREVRRRWPELPTTVVFTRCTLCNGLLELRPAEPAPPHGVGIPESLLRDGGPLYGCGSCGHLYWEGSHTARIRRTIEAWELGLPG
jgi:uncharacterized protein